MLHLKNIINNLCKTERCQSHFLNTVQVLFLLDSACLEQNNTDVKKGIYKFVMTLGRQEKNYPFNKEVCWKYYRMCANLRSTYVFTLTTFHRSSWEHMKPMSFKLWLPQSLSSHWKSSWATWLDQRRWRTAGRFLRWTSRSPARGDARLLCGRVPLLACTMSVSQPPTSGSHEWRRKMTPVESVL